MQDYIELENKQNVNSFPVDVSLAHVHTSAEV